jgi:hypothetical protein
MRLPGWGVLPARLKVGPALQLASTTSDPGVAWGNGRHTTTPSRCAHFITQTVDSVELSTLALELGRLNTEERLTLFNGFDGDSKMKDLMLQDLKSRRDDLIMLLDMDSTLGVEMRRKIRGDITSINHQIDSLGVYYGG